MKLILAEDDAVSAKALALWLRKEGHEVLVASSGAEAWELFQGVEVELVLSDWMMPGLDGLDLCRKIRENRRREYCYVVLMTAVHQGRDALKEAMAAGVDDYMAKPLDRELLAMRMVVAERIWKANRQIRRLEELLPICMYCKRIRDDGNYWQQLEAYLHERTGSRFSHGVCPECFTREHGELGGQGVSSLQR